MAALDELMRPPDNPATPYNQGVRNILHELFVQPVKQAGEALQGRMTDAEAQDFAFGAALGLIPMGRGIKPIRAYHGSPHDFDRFDMSKIGTGEGAQAYGHGLYFAEAEPVAQSYKYATIGRHADHVFDGKPLKENADWYKTVDDLNATGDWRLAKALESYSKSIEPDPALRLRQLKEWHRNDPGMVDAFDRLASRVTTKVPEGKMYEVNINAHPDQFLDWDKPLNKGPLQDVVAQSAERVLRDTDYGGLRNEAKDAMVALRGGNMTGEGAYDKLALLNANVRPAPGGRFIEPNKVAATNALQEAGIPGIKYLDQGSRTAGEGSRNYVVFNDKLIDILRKYGLAGLMAGGAATDPLQQLMTEQ